MECRPAGSVQSWTTAADSSGVGPTGGVGLRACLITWGRVAHWDFNRLVISRWRTLAQRWIVARPLQSVVPTALNDAAASPSRGYWSSAAGSLTTARADITTVEGGTKPLLSSSKQRRRVPGLDLWGVASMRIRPAPPIRASVAAAIDRCEASAPSRNFPACMSAGGRERNWPQCWILTEFGGMEWYIFMTDLQPSLSSLCCG
jgi:hypothetical protein